MKTIFTTERWDCDRCDRVDCFDPEEPNRPGGWLEFSYPFPYEKCLLCDSCVAELRKWVQAGPFKLPSDTFAVGGVMTKVQGPFNVHNHDIDPSCKETVLVDGRRIGECLFQ